MGRARRNHGRGGLAAGARREPDRRISVLAGGAETITRSERPCPLRARYALKSPGSYLLSSATNGPRPHTHATGATRAAAAWTPDTGSAGRRPRGFARAATTPRVQPRAVPT